MLNITDRFFLSIFWNGQEMPLDILSFNSLQMHSSTQMGFPVAKLQLGDTVGYFEDNPIVDADILNIRCGRQLETSITTEYTWRVFKVVSSKEGSIEVYNIYLLPNAPRYINENFKGAITGRASDVIRAIAEISNLQADVDNTSDNQVWYGCGEKRVTFASYVTQHAYLNNTSCFLLGFTLDGRLKLKNISAVDFLGTNSLFVKGPQVTEGTIQVIGKKEILDSGLMNNLAAYRLETLVQRDEGNTRETSVEIPATTNTININESMNTRLSGSKIHICPIDSGNTHSNYYVAEHQNKRIKATFGSGLYLACNEETNRDLFDPLKFILFDNVNAEVKVNNKLSGGYMVTGKTIFIRPGYYYEKLKVVRQGYNVDVVTQDNLRLLGVK